ncbi:MAG: superoxide dismutase [Nocardioidaceae bacterium]
MAYLGSLADGDIYRLNLRTGRGRVISEGPGTPSVGLKLDRRGRLFIAGGPAGNGRVVDTRTGKVLASYSFATDVTAANPSFVNDVVLTRHAAWFTDSNRAVLYKVPTGRRVATQSQVSTVPLGGAWRQTPDQFNANGIAATPDRSALLVVRSFSGQVYRVSPATGVARVVDLNGFVASNGDGLLVRGRTLYVVQNRQNRVAMLTLDRSGTSGRLRGFLRSPDFDVPTTIAVSGGHAYLPNARFGIESAETATYSVTRVPLHRRHGHGG